MEAPMDITILAYDINTVDVHVNDEKDWKNYLDDVIIIRLQGSDGDIKLALDFDTLKKVIKTIKEKGI